MNDNRVITLESVETRGLIGRLDEEEVLGDERGGIVDAIERREIDEEGVEDEMNGEVWIELSKLELFSSSSSMRFSSISSISESLISINNSFLPVINSFSNRSKTFDEEIETELLLFRLENH